MQLTELDLDGGNDAEAVTVMFRGGARAAIGQELGEVAPKGSSGPLDSAGSLGVELRGRWWGQGGPAGIGDGGLRWRRCLRSGGGGGCDGIRGGGYDVAS